MRASGTPRGHITLKVHGKGDKVRIVPLKPGGRTSRYPYLTEFHPLRLRKIGCSSPFTAACTPRCRGHHRPPAQEIRFSHTRTRPLLSPRTCTPTCSRHSVATAISTPARRFCTSGLPRTCGSEHDHGLRACRWQRDSECGRGRQPENRRPIATAEKRWEGKEQYLLRRKLCGLA